MSAAADGSTRQRLSLTQWLMPDRLLRSVIQERVVSEVVDAQRHNHPRLDEVIEAIEWLLARRPDEGYLIPETHNPEYYLGSV